MSEQNAPNPDEQNAKMAMKTIRREIKGILFRCAGCRVFTKSTIPTSGHFP